MKRYAFYMLVMAVAAVAACQKESAVDNAQEPAQKTYTYTVKASIDDVKSDYDADGKFSWSAGDAISVLFHNGDVNKFFTLTTTADGTASASFSGEIEAGYEIGASDQTSVDKMIWVLYPASTKHSYVAGDAKPARFYMEPETDFTALGAHWSANMPMYDLLADEGDITFKNMAVGYKFTVSDIDAAVSKIQFTVENQNLGSSWYALSGTIKIHAGDVYLDHSGANASTAIISYIANVDPVTHKAEFYVPFRYYASGFKPIITIRDYNTGNLIKTLTAANVASGITSKGKVQPISISAPGAGTPPTFVSAFGLDWSSISDSVIGNSGTISSYNNRVNVFKATADASYLYVYFEMDASALNRDSEHDYANPFDIYIGNGESTSSSWMWNASTKYTVNPRAAYLTKNGIPAVNSWEGIYAGSGSDAGKAEKWGGKCAFEVKLKRAYNACLQVTGTLNIGIVINYEKWNGGGSTANYMYVPSNGSNMLQIDAPAYVAP